MSRFYLYEEWSEKFGPTWFKMDGDFEITLEDDLQLYLDPPKAVIHLEEPIMLEQEIVMKQKEIEYDDKKLLRDLIEEIVRGNHIVKALKKELDEENVSHAKFLGEDKSSNFVLTGSYQKDSNNGLEYINKKTIKNQRQVIGYILRQLGSCLLSGRSIMTISLPVNVFDNRTILQRTAQTFGYAPFFLEKGGITADPLEQFKLAITFWVTTMHLQTGQEKPFDAICGETFQANLGDCNVYIEHIMHEPQVSCFQVYGKNFQMMGSAEYFVDTSANSVKGHQIGNPRIIFKNNKTTVYFQMGYALITGTALGKRTYNWTGKAYAYDLEHGFYCELTFDQGSDWFSKKKTTKDYFSGSIWRATEKLMEKITHSVTKHKEIKFATKDKEDFEGEICKVEGMWLDHIAFDGKIYWKFDDYRPYLMMPAKNPLPSDSNYRLDLLHFKLGDEAKAQEIKTKTEDAQRQDTKLRLENEKKNSKGAKSKKH
jgi:hypothetical protein